ncbi:telethonin-like [Heptranchias perlo]|uniref:telethonin-like n=1 Tax=Heptranchias perlo TaxID=212740 RepID=UPI00355980D1
MSSVSELKTLGGGLLFTALSCDIKEDNSTKRERFTAYWEDLIMVTKPASRTALAEDSSTRKEHYVQNQRATFIVQRSPDQRMRMGRLGEKASEYQLPYRNVLPVPVFVPSKIPSVAKEDLMAEHSLTPEELRAVEKFERALNPRRSCPDKQEGSEMKKELPRIIQPTRVNFRASSLLSPPDMYSQPEAVHRS